MAADCEDCDRVSRLTAGEDVRIIHRSLSVNGHPSALAACLLSHPDVVTELSFGFLADDAALDLSRYIATTKTLRTFTFYGSNLSMRSYRCIIFAFTLNTSIQEFTFCDSRRDVIEQVVPEFNTSFDNNRFSPFCVLQAIHSVGSVFAFTARKRAAFDPAHSPGTSQ